jgi:TonB-dependent receptor
MNDQLKLSDSEGTASTNLGALGAFSYNITSEHQIGGNIFYSRSATSTARYQQGFWPQELGNERIVMNRVLGFKERDILSTQVRGEHYLSSLLNLTVDWDVSISETHQNEPDQRLVFSYVDTTRDPNIHTIVGSNFDDPSRYYRDLEDQSNNYNLNFTLPFAQWNGLMSKFKFGGTYQNSDRVFNERIFSYDVENEYFREVNGDVGALFDNKYNGIVEADTSSSGRVRYTFGNVIRDNSKPKNNYTGEQKVAAFYGMFEMPITRRLKFVGGLRYETTEIEVVSDDESQEVGKITEEDYLPSINFIYQLSEDMNLRAAATQTLARPNFREIAPYSSKEFVNGYELQGNPNLDRTLIQNYDLRWEWFTRPGEIFAISGFYKKMENPIERAFASGTTESNRIITYTNVDNATILGAEFEARMNLDFISDKLSNFSLGTNLSLVSSEIDIPESELNARKAIDSTSSSHRVLQGQSPYIFNIDLSYNNLDWGTSISLHFNTFGERLSKVSANLTPDVYEQPADKLDLIASQKLYQGLSIKFSAKNILNSPYKEVYKYQGDEYVFHKYNRGVSYSFGLSYEL